MQGGSDPLLLKIGVMALVLNLFNLLPGGGLSGLVAVEDRLNAIQHGRNAPGEARHVIQQSISRKV